MTAAIAAAPLVGSLLWIVVLRRSAFGAGAIGVAIALAIATAVPAFALDSNGIGLAGLRGLLVAFVVGYVIYFGLLLYRLSERAGGQATLAALLAHLPGDRAARALILCIPVGAFFEAVSGFGLGVVVVAPLLVGIGYSHRAAALLALFTQNAVPWGAGAVGVVFSGALSGLPIDAIGLGCAILLAPVFVYYAFLTLVVAEDRGAMRRHAGLALIVGLAMALAAGLGTYLLGVELAMVVGGPLVAAIAVTWTWRGHRTEPADAPPRGLAAALAPYVVLVAVLLASRLIAPLRDILRGIAVVRVPVVEFEMALLYSSGFALALACLVAILVGRLSPGTIVAPLRGTTRQWLRAFAALVAFTVTAEVMARSGMTRDLATSVALTFGSGYALVAPALGGLSGFLTGSNAAGSAMLLPFQLVAAERIGLAPLVVTAAQNAAAAVFSMASPARVVLAATVAGEPGSEPTLIRAALVFCLGSLVLMTIAELAWIAWLA